MQTRTSAIVPRSESQRAGIFAGMAVSKPKRSSRTRSPLKSPPLRMAGQSVNEALERVRDDKVLDSLVVVVIAMTMTLVAGIQWWLKTPPAALFFVTLTYLIGALVYAFFRIRGARGKIHTLRLGRNGEAAVAEYLETLGRDGVRALHDLVADGFNIDHVAVTPQGVLVIETKTISKPVGKDARITFDGEKIKVGGLEPERDPVKQARAAASWVKRQLNEALGKNFPVRPVVAYPGWFVERTKSASSSDTWVVEPKAIGPFLKQEATVLTDADMAQIVYFLKRLSRTQTGM